MAKSLLNQFTQTRGSRTHDASMTMSLAEYAGRSVSSGTISISDTSVTSWTGTAFTEGNVGDYLVISGTAYEITAYVSGTAVTLASAPGDGSGVSATHHTRKNLEDDLNYIRTQLNLVVGENNWYTAPTTSLSGIQNTVDNLSFTSTFAELTDTPSGYSANEIVYYTASGTTSNSNFTFDPATNDFNVGTASSAGFSSNSTATTATVRGDADTYLVVSGTSGSFVDNDELVFAMTNETQQLGKSAGEYILVDNATNDNITFGIGGSAQVTIDANGLTLSSGTSVNEIVDSTGSIDSNSTDNQLATTKLIYNQFGGTALSGTPSYMYYVGADGNIATTPNMTYVNGSGVDFAEHVAIGSNASVNSAIGLALNDTVSGTGYGIYSYIVEESTTTANMTGIYSFTNQSTANSTVTDVIGIQGRASVASDGSTVSDVVAGLFNTANGSSYGTATSITSLAALEAQINDLGNAGGANLTITDAYGLNIKSAGALSGANASNLYGLYIGDQSSSGFDTAYNIYSAGSTADNFFEGNVTVSGVLQLATGTTVNEITTLITSPGSDDKLASEQAIVEHVATVSGALNDSIIWEIVDTPTTQIRPKVAYLQHAIYTEGNVTIGGDLTVTGTLFYTNTETVQVSDNLMVINYGESGAGVTAGEAGIQVDRGSETDYQFLFDEGTDTFRIGVSGTQDAFNSTALQPVATREDNPVSMRVPWWDTASNTLRTMGDAYITVNSGTDEIVIGVADESAAIYVGEDGTNYNVSLYTPGEIINTFGSAEKFSVEAGSTQVLELTVDGLQLNKEIGSSAVYVDEILNVTDGDSIDASSTDNQLATAKLIYTTYSGLENAVGGTPTYMYYVDSNGDISTTAALTYDPDPAAQNGGWGDDAGEFVVASGTDFIITEMADAFRDSGDDYLLLGSDRTNESSVTDRASIWIENYSDQSGNQVGLYSGSTSYPYLEVERGRIIAGRTGTNWIEIDETNSNIQFGASNGTVEMTLDANGMSLKSGASVNEILDSNDTLSAASTDDQLATAKLIYNELQAISTGSGTVDHSLLSNLDYASSGHTGFQPAGSYLTSESDPVFTSSAAYGISAGDITNWDTAASGVVTNASNISSNDSDIAGLSNISHQHYEIDLTLSGSNVWTVSSGIITGLDTNNMDVYLNGLLNRDNDGEYFTSTVDGDKLTVTFAYNTYETDWAHVKFIKYQTS